MWAFERLSAFGRLTAAFHEAPSGWPPSLSEIAVILGREKTLRLVGAMREEKQHGRAWRCEFYVPNTVPPDHPIAEAIGLRAARRLAEYFGGLIMKVSNGTSVERLAKVRACFRLQALGLGSAAIAERVGLSDRRVRQFLSIPQLAAEGLEAGEIARRIDVSAAIVGEVLAEGPPEGMR